jgi:nucleoside-diphosphate-sugar epimerase
MRDNPLSADLDHILDHTRDLWDELRGERLFITGGTGFFGCWLLESFAWVNDLLGLNASVLVLTRDLEAFRKKAPHLAGNPAIQFLAGDLRSFAFPDGNFSHIIHAATESSAKLNTVALLAMFITIVDGTRHTLEFARQCRAQKFLLASSGAVYGRQPPEMTHIQEDYPGAPDQTDPRSAYGEGKRAAELLCALYAKQYGLEVKIARCFAFVGPYLPLDSHFAIGNFIRDGLNGGPIEILGDGTPHRSYLYASDLAIWLWTILFRGPSCRPYNVGSEFSISIAKLAKIVADKSKPVSKIYINSPVPSVIPVEHYVPSTYKGRKELDLLHWIDLDTAIQKTIHWYLEMSRQ